MREREIERKRERERVGGVGGERGVGVGGGGGETRSKAALLCRRSRRERRPEESTRLHSEVQDSRMRGVGHLSHTIGFEAILKKSIPTKLCQLILYISKG